MDINNLSNVERAIYISEGEKGLQKFLNRQKRMNKELQATSNAINKITGVSSNDKAESLVINLNCNARIKLTDYGKLVNEKLLCPYRYINIDGDVYIEDQLWKIMKDFGHEISPLQNGDQPFETDKLELFNNYNLIQINY
jgi:hypothetical protein